MRVEIHINGFGDGMYRAVLFGNGDGACPQTPLRGDVIFDDLRRAFGFTQEKLYKINERIEADREKTAVIPLTATSQQLDVFGFVGL
jgi:hypothetical protein